MTQVLLDTHALVWWLEAREQLSAKARKIIEDSETTIFVSAASAWEGGHQIPDWQVPVA